jgi:predicted permease
MTAWLDDLGYAARRLLRSPGFALTALTILVIGIGANATAFSVVNALLLQPPPFLQPEELVLVLQDDDRGAPSSTSYPAYRDMTGSVAFQSVSAFYNDQAFLEQEDRLAPILVEYATASYREVIGLSASRGSWFGPEHDDPNGPPAAVITYGMWADRMARDPDVLGSTLRVNGGAVTVVGVGPPEFNGGQGPAAVDLWLSISAMGATGGRVASLERRQDHPFTVRARLAEGVTVQQARDAMEVLATDLARTYPELNAGRGITVLPLLDVRVSPSIDAQMRAAGAFTMAVVTLVLLIGTLNLANLLLVRSTARTREIAVRLALGAGRRRVVRVVMAEALLLAGLGGLGGLGAAAVFAEMSRNSRLDFTIPVLLDLRLDARVLLFTMLLSAVTGLVFGILPAMRATRRDVNATLRDEAVSGLGSRRSLGLTGALVAGQVAVSLLLLLAAGGFVKGLLMARTADPGFDWERTAYVQVSAAPLGLNDEATLALFEQIDERMEALPGVRRAATSLMLPAAMFGTSTLLLGSEVDGTDRPAEIPWNYVSPDYFRALGMEALHGRLFEEADVGGADVAVVSETFARTYYGRSDVVGRTYRSEGSPETPREIIGVVGDVTVRALGETPQPAIYWPLDFAYPRMTFIIAADGDPSASLSAVRAAVRAVDPRIMVLQASSMSDHLGDTLERQRLASLVLACLGGLALLLAVLGMYGVVSFAVAQRRREVGIRIALGARPGAVIRLFLRDVSLVVLLGVAVGAALSVPLGRLAARFSGSSLGAPETAAVGLLLLATSLIATIVPAARATRTHPTEALCMD